MAEDNKLQLVEFPEKSGKLTRENLAEYQENILIRNARKLLPALMRSLNNRLAMNDAKAADQVMSLYGYTKSAPTAVINNLMQNNTFNSEDSSMYFEKIISMMEKRDERASDDVIDAEVID